ncbi:MAG: OmpA family protein [Candidatus Thiocaldithrix dubininis]|jgi:outer membrane protein OmpA-like peptidoglycan-associated protein|uniref:OmpA family protein n=1 Tax=Candidatus Thiocaldithrix dubininis TaxID=3080823 RepID=A0AA95H9X5_9GAMM|nr:MAG: OmpA family protein [Candidatus Thiocaldithrix dubininis]
MKSLFGENTNYIQDTEEQWLSVSDLMSGLMIVFLFIAITYMRTVKQENTKMREVAVAYQENQVSIYDALMKEFKNDLSKWNAKIDQETLSFEFNSPDVLFDNGETSIKNNFKAILEDFFPRYINQIRPFRSSINEIRLEGHTSSSWGTTVSETDAYFNNMALSQGRTRSVLQYIYQLPNISHDQNWIKTNIAAVGFSSARPVINNSLQEDSNASRRVTFRIITNSEIQIKKILEK